MNLIILSMTRKINYLFSNVKNMITSIIKFLFWVLFRASFLWKGFKSFIKEWYPCFLSIAAVIVSYNSYVISKNQLSINKVSVKPYFYVVKIPIYNSSKNIVEQYALKIFNIGAPVEIISSEVRVFYKINDLRKIGEKILPVDGYYYGAFPTGNPKGLISTYLGLEKDFENLNNTFVYKNITNPLSFIKIDFEQVTYISYVSFNDSIHYVCFLGSRKVNCNFVDSYIKLFNLPSFDLKNMTYANLIEKYKRFSATDLAVFIH